MVLLLISILAFFLGLLGTLLYLRCIGTDVKESSKKRSFWSGVFGFCLLALAGAMDVIAFQMIR